MADWVTKCGNGCEKGCPRGSNKIQIWWFKGSLFFWDTYLEVWYQVATDSLTGVANET